MSRNLFIATIILSPLYSFAQELSPQAIYLNVSGGRTAYVLSYDRRFAEEFSFQSGVGLNNLDRTASTTFRFGASYLRGDEHILEFSAVVDIWTKVFNPIAREDLFPVFFVGYRYQPDNGLMFRFALNLSQINKRFFDSSEWAQNVLLGCVGYSF